MVLPHTYYPAQYRAAGWSRGFGLRRRLHLSVVALLSIAMLAGQVPAYAVGRATTAAAATGEATPPSSTPSHVALVGADRADRAQSAGRARIVDAYG